MSDLFFWRDLMFGVDLRFSSAFFCIGFAAYFSESWNRDFFACFFNLFTFFSHFFFQICHFQAGPLGKLEKYRKIAKQKNAKNMQNKCNKNCKKCKTSKKDIKTRNKNAVSACFFRIFPYFFRCV